MQGRANIKIPLKSLAPRPEASIPVAPGVVASANVVNLPEPGIKKLPPVIPKMAAKIPSKVIRRGDEDIPAAVSAPPSRATEPANRPQISFPKKIVIPVGKSKTTQPEINELVQGLTQLSVDEAPAPEPEPKPEPEPEAEPEPEVAPAPGPVKRKIVLPVKTQTIKRVLVSPGRKQTPESEVMELVTAKPMGKTVAAADRGAKSKRIDVFRPTGAQAKSSKVPVKSKELSLLDEVRMSVRRDPGLVPIEPTRESPGIKPPTPTRTAIVIRGKTDSKNKTDEFLLDPDYEEKLAKLPSVIDRDLLEASQQSRTAKGKSYTISELKAYLQDVTGRVHTGKKEELARKLLDLYELGLSISDRY